MCDFMSKFIRTFVFILVIIVFCHLNNLFAQRTAYNIYADHEYFRGLELFSNEKYGAAQEQFARVIAKYGDDHSEIARNAEYYNALCAVKLFNDDAEYLLYRFISRYPESPKINHAYFELGKFAYEKRNYSTALKWFEYVDKYELSEEDMAEYLFKKGYSHFQRDDYEQSRIAFYEIKDTDQKYALPATYYYAHIAYDQGNYETALEGFLKLSDDETFSPIVPYYVSQIYYLQKKWDEVIRYAPPLLETVTEKRYAEVSKIIGEAYFQTEQYEKALPYLEKYHELTGGASREDRYQIGFAYYMTFDYKKAEEYFKTVSMGKDELSQSALYHLADCYLHLDQKYQARLSFAAAARMDWDPVIKEDALFNYAVVTYELSYNPFNEAILAFNRYISLYPSSERTDEAYNYLVLAFMSTKNYKNALASLDRIRRKTPDIEKAYQRVAYFRGLELFNNLLFNEAINKFDASLEYGQYDLSLKALCIYWKGESYYRLKDFDRAIENYNRFLLSEGAADLNVYNICHYNIAYAFFEKKEYDQALTWFRKYESISGNDRSSLLGDCYNRIGDIHFLNSRYQAAVEYYDKAIELGLMDVDYALFQKGFSLGLMGQHENKISVLSEVLNKYKTSSYIPDALYETGRSYFILQQPRNSIPRYQRILTDYPNSSYASKALLQLGLIYYNLNENDESLNYYKQVIENYPGTPEANSALLGMKNVYVDMNRVDDYFEYVDNLGIQLDISASEQDSLTYIAAENVYMTGDCDKSKESFSHYIDRFEDGKFIVQAYFYKAECHLRDGEYSEALESYRNVINRPRNAFTEPALAASAKLNYNLENYAEALENYLMLEEVADMKSNLTDARVGKMRCYYELEEYVNTIDAGRQVLMNEKISEELARETHYKIAKSFYEQGRFALALEEFKIIAKEVRSPEGAEAKYRKAELLYIRKEYQEAENEIFDFIDMNTPHQYWMAKAFILLADLYLEKDDRFQAIQTLQSIIDYYENTTDGIIDLAMRKKAEIQKMEEAEQPESEEGDLEIEIKEE
jgi:TolA-binding protein